MDDDGSEGSDGGVLNLEPTLEVHCHPKAGVPMTVIVHPVEGMSESGKSIRIDMLLAGE